MKVSDDAKTERIEALTVTAKKIAAMFKRKADRQTAVDLIVNEGKGMPITRGLATSALLTILVCDELPATSRAELLKLLAFDAA